MRIATARYVLTGRVQGVSHAVRGLTSIAASHCDETETLQTY